jgi:nitroreductase
MGTVAEAVDMAVEAAVQAPSVHNTQPWRFTVGDGRIGLRADPDRRLEVADPQGREMLISCGAALFTLRAALVAAGYRPRVEVLPDPDRPHLLADVHLDARTDADDEHARRLFQAVRGRRTHRGGFRAGELGAPLLTALKQEAEQEGARLVQCVEANTRYALAGLTQAAEHVQRLDPAYAAERARWAPAPSSGRADGVPEAGYPQRPPHTEPDFTGRDFARGHGWGIPEIADGGAGHGEASTGAVALVTTAGDGPEDWLAAGQALQRVLLRAAAEEDVAAAFHTQVLEIPELRDFVRVRFCGGWYPQMLLRLGVPEGPEPETVRRPLDEVVDRAR